MIQRLSFVRTAGLALAAALTLGSGAFAQTPAPASNKAAETQAAARRALPSRGADVVVQGVTQPSLRKELAFNFEGIIGKVSVKDGDTVAAGQELMRQEDELELARLQGLKLTADQSLLIKAKKATLENKKLVLKRSEDLYAKKALTITELQQAQVDVVLAEAEVDLAGHEGETKQSDVSQQSIRIAKLTLKSPVAGVVEKVIQTEGEVANLQKPSVTVVTNDPLYIDIKTLRTAVVQRLKKGDTLAVRYPGEDQWKPATINLIAPVADARADTQAIRLEMANPDNRSTGVSIDVKIPTPGVAGMN